MSKFDAVASAFDALQKRFDAVVDNRPPRMQIVWSVLEMAKDAGDARVIGACRRLIEANRLGWKDKYDPSDYRMVRDFTSMFR